MNLANDAILERDDTIPVTELDGELVFLNVQSGKYYVMKGTARRVWELLATPISVESLLTRLAEEYRVEKDQCAMETMPFLENLLGANMARRRSI